MPHAATLQQSQPPPPPLSDPQFLSIEVAPATDGSLWVTSTATYADEPNCELINDEFINDEFGKYAPQTVWR